jgi:pentatricopeptide repeat protein
MLEELRTSEDALPAWVYDIFVLVYGQKGFVPEAFKSLQYRRAHADPTPPDLAHFLLDACSSAAYYQGTKELWGEVVGPDGEDQSGQQMPSDGTVQNVMNTAAAHSDVEMAMQALEILIERKVQMRVHHFEPMIESYSANGDLDGALRTLCYMRKAGLDPRKDSTRPFFQRLREHPEDIALYDRALRQLKSNSESGVPLAAVNVLIEAQCATCNTASALQTYSELQSHFGLSPNADTFLPFFQFDAPDDLKMEMAKESTRYDRCIPALPAKTLARLASLATRKGHLDVAGALLLKMDESYQAEKRERAGDQTELDTAVPDAWVKYQDEVRDVTEALLAADQSLSEPFKADEGGL